MQTGSCYHRELFLYWRCKIYILWIDIRWSFLYFFIVITGFIWGEEHHSSKWDQHHRAGAAGDDAWHLAQCVSLPGHCGDLLPAPCYHHHQLCQDILHHLNVRRNRNTKYYVCQGDVMRQNILYNPTRLLLCWSKGNINWNVCSLENLSFNFILPTFE